MFDWAAYFELAEELAEREDEASKRSAVSRAYYASFNSARRFLLSDPEAGRLMEGKSEDHFMVWKVFSEGPDRLRRQIGAVGDRLKRSRRQADFADEVPRLPDLAQDAIHKARRILANLNSLRKPVLGDR